MNNEHLDLTIKDRSASRTPAALPVLLPELAGSKAAWAGVETAELLQRGCDQRGLLDRLAAKGIRHVIVPLNGASEDSCLFARKHVDLGLSNTPAPITLYDLAHRDEGAFTRLKFMLEAARSSGLLIGLSLFDASPSVTSGPFRKGGNIQGATLAAAPSSPVDEKLFATLGSVVDWICSAVRGFRGLWIDVFRNASGTPSALERLLCARVAETLARHGDDLSPARLGPWIAVRRPDMLRERHSAQAAPFDISRDMPTDCPALDFASAMWAAESAAGTSESDFIFQRAPHRQPALLRFSEHALDGARSDWLWRAFFRGYWPTAALHVNQASDAPHLNTLAAIARFSVVWAGRGALRPYPEMLAPMHESVGASMFAAEDGTGRFFAYFSEPAVNGLALALPPGFYRFYWFDPYSDTIMDRDEGVEGGPRISIPGCMDATAKLLIFEQDESPDPLSVW
ncbi:MAG: hypothetical protein WCT04_06115 [Planctomycetota bacterium]